MSLFDTMAEGAKLASVKELVRLCEKLGAAREEVCKARELEAAQAA